MTSSTSRVAGPDEATSDRPRALTTPALTEPANPKGLPMATTSCPTRKVSASPSGAGAYPSPAARTTARSENRSVPITSKATSSPEENVAVPPPPPSTTWAEVTSRPSPERTTAEPDPAGALRPSPPRTRRLATDGTRRSATSTTARE